VLEKYKYLALGALTYIPGLHALLRRGTGGSTSARYCYSVWLRHLVSNARAGLPVRIRALAEIGSGDSLGIGFTALLSGVERYYALDAVRHAGSERNLAIFDELLTLLRERTPIPGPDEFPSVNPRVDDHAFPHELLPDALLQQSLAPDRVARLRRDVSTLSGSVEYVAGQYGEESLPAGCVDAVLSQAVLEHVDDLQGVYRAMYRWLTPGGYMSHQVDLKCHATSSHWNGHLGYRDLTWKMMRGRLPYFINRRVLSEHLEYLREAGFEIVAAHRLLRDDGLSRSEVAPRFRQWPEDELRTAGAFIQSRKPAGLH
jgi:hypothetical protein